MSMGNDSENQAESELVQELRRNSDLTAELIRVHKDWRISLRNGLAAGLGTAIGATVLVSLLVWMLQPFQRLDVLKPSLDRLTQELQRGHRR